MTHENRTTLCFLALLGVCVLAVAIGVGIGYLLDDDGWGIVLMQLLVAAVFWGGLLLISKLDSKLENRRRAP
jgi:hypothetical protein